MVEYISDRVVVIYPGTIVEEAPSNELYAYPMHPYTQVLLSSIPLADPHKTRQKERIQVKGEISSPINPPEFSQFSDQCPHATEQSRQEKPVMKEVTADHRDACHLMK